MIMIPVFMIWPLLHESNSLNARTKEEENKIPEFEFWCRYNYGALNPRGSDIRFSLYNDFLVLAYVSFKGPIVLLHSEIERIQFDERDSMFVIVINHTRRDLPVFTLNLGQSDLIQKIADVIGSDKMVETDLWRS